MNLPWSALAYFGSVGDPDYQGTYDASTAAYPGSGSAGHYYKVTTAGTISGTSYAVGEYFGYDGSNWAKILVDKLGIDVTEDGKVLTTSYDETTDTPPGEVEVMIHANGSNGSTTITDVSSNSLTCTATNAVLSTAQKRFGKSSILFNGTNAKVVVDYNAVLNTAAQDFNKELWVYFVAKTGTRYLMGQETADTSGKEWKLFYDATDGICFSYATAAGDWTDEINAAWDPTLNTWYHIRVIRCTEGAVDYIRVFVNGTMMVEYDCTGDTINASAEDMWIGASPVSGGSDWFSGYIDEIRYTNDECWCSTEFIPADLPYYTITGYQEEDIWVNSGNVGIGVAPATARKLKILATQGDEYAGLEVSNTSAHQADSDIHYGGMFYSNGVDPGYATTENYAVYANASGADTNYSFFGGAGDIYNAGNVGIGGASKTWASGYKFLQLGDYSTIADNSSSYMTICSNVYYSTTGYKQITNGVGSSFHAMYGGQHLFFVAPDVGGADTAITPTQAMTIDSSGNVGIGRTPTVQLDVYRASGAVYTHNYSASLAHTQQSSIYAGGAGDEDSATSASRYSLIGVTFFNGVGSDESFGFSRMDSSDGDNNHLWFSDGNILYTSTTFSNMGGTSGTAVGDQTSDIRLKSNVASSSKGLAEILQLEPISFKYKKGKTSETRLGFSAQQVQPIIPEVVYNTHDFVPDESGTDIELQKEEKDKDGKIIKQKVIKKGKRDKLAMRYAEIVPVLVNAIKEQQSEIEELKNRIETLEGK